MLDHEYTTEIDKVLDNEKLDPQEILDRLYGLQKVRRMSKVKIASIPCIGNCESFRSSGSCTWCKARYEPIYKATSGEYKGKVIFSKG